MTNKGNCFWTIRSIRTVDHCPKSSIGHDSRFGVVHSFVGALILQSSPVVCELCNGLTKKRVFNI